MAVDEDDDYIFYGTPLEREEELGRRKGKRALEQGQARRKAPWQQEVTDADGRRRFHGAFTGGFSAGYYNTVGSKEGWTPASFSSSRTQRASKKEQLVYDFLDEDEKEELKQKELASSAEYDTFGSTAAELARNLAYKESKGRPSAIPGAIADEIVIPAVHSIGFKLLMKMGWRQGRGIGPQHIAATSDIQRKGRKATLALSTTGERDTESDHSSELAEICDDERNEMGEEGSVRGLRNIPVFLSHPKMDVHGLGFYAYKLSSDEGGITNLAVRKQSKPQLVSKEEDSFPYFNAATQPSYQMELFRFPLELIPLNFTGKHTFETHVDVHDFASQPEPLKVLPPDPQQAKVIEGLAAFVARSGQRFELMLKQKHGENSQFGFLFGGTSHDYYIRRLWEERKILAEQGKNAIYASNRQAEFLGAQRGRVLGELPLASASLAVEPINAPSSQVAVSTFEGLSEITIQMNNRFTAGGTTGTALTPVQQNQLDSVLKASISDKDLNDYPTREEKSWRPTAVLCKRFNLPNPPFQNNPIPASCRKGVQRENVALHALETRAGPSGSMFNQLQILSANKSAAVKYESPGPSKEEIVEVDVIPQKPIDLYKAIFSDDDDDDDDEERSSTRLIGEDEGAGEQGLVAKRSHAAFAVLNSLSAGDFLESLGQELGLRVQEQRVPPY